MSPQPTCPTPVPDTAQGPAAADRLRDKIVAKLTYQVGKAPGFASERDWFVATALAVRDSVLDCSFSSVRRTYASGAKRVYYLSLEFLIGRLLFDAIGNLGLMDDVRAALALEGIDLDRLREQEPDAALGNGGLGRLAACFMESMATLGIPAIGYGIRYEHGLFRQMLQNGIQQELPEDWLSLGNPWEFERADIAYPGRLRRDRGPDHGRGRPYVTYAWQPAELLSAVAYDMPVIGGPGAARVQTAHAASSIPIRSVCGRPGQRRPCTSTTSTAATMSAPCATGSGPRRCRACCIPATRATPARSCGCGRSSSSPPRRCRTCCAGT